MDVQLVPVTLETLPTFSGLITGVARWLEARGTPIWTPEELTPETLLEAYRLHELYGVALEGRWVGTAVLAEQDLLVWPQDPPGEALYLHKLSIARAFAGRGLSGRVLGAAVAEVRSRGRRWLRLETSRDHPPLMALYERHGMQRAGEGQVGRYAVMRYQLEVKR